MGWLIFAAYILAGLWCAWTLLTWVVKEEGTIDGTDLFIALCMVLFWPIFGPFLVLSLADWSWLSDLIQDRLDREVNDDTGSSD